MSLVGWEGVVYDWKLVTKTSRSTPGPVLAEMASRVPPVSSAKEEMNSTAERPS